MDGFPWGQTVVGWVHITSAAAVAGFFFVWLIALPAGGSNAVSAVVTRYRPVFWTAALLLPLTGAYTWYVRTGQNYPDFYFHTLYTKIGLYVVLFGLAGAMTSPRARGSLSDRLGMLGLCVFVTLVILFLSAFMRRVQPRTPVPSPTAHTLIRPGTDGGPRIVTKKGVASGWQS